MISLMPEYDIAVQPSRSNQMETIKPCYSYYYTADNDDGEVQLRNKSPSLVSTIRGGLTVVFAAFVTNFSGVPLHWFP